MFFKLYNFWIASFLAKTGRGIAKDGERDRNDDARRPSLRMGIKNQTV